MKVLSKSLSKVSLSRRKRGFGTLTKRREVSILADGCGLNDAKAETQSAVCIRIWRL